MDNLFNERVCKFSCVNLNTVKWIQSDGGKEYIGDSF